MLTAPLTLGIEEEYMIIDPQTRELTSFVQKMVEEGRVVLGDQVKPEFMQSQIEVGTNICRDIHEARVEIIRLRREVCKLAEEHGRKIAAASTHPFSHWEAQDRSEGERYEDLESDMQIVSRQLLIFGMHVHIGFGMEMENLDLLIDIQNQIRYFLPHILAFTTSSPFWHGRDTGLKSYRSIIFANLPRTGIPPVFNSFSDYAEMLDLFSRVGSLGKDSNMVELPGGKKGDPTKIWWDARPQQRFGTLEIRIADIPTTVDEVICIAAVLQAIVAKLIKIRNGNRSWRIYRGELIEENKWRAVRYGIDGKMVDWGRREEVPLRFLARELLELVDDVLDDLGSRKDVEYLNTILEKGTSADRQLATYRRAIRDGAAPEGALKAVVDQLIEETGQGW